MSAWLTGTEPVAVWVQAIGTLIALVIAIAVPAWQTHVARLDERKKGAASKLALRKALWNDVSCVQDLAYREAQWWRKEMGDQRFGATELRLFGHIQSVVFETNLNRITDIPFQAADALLAMHAGISIVQDAHKVFYQVEDKIIDAVKAGTSPDIASKAEVMSSKGGVQHIKANQARTFHGLCRIAMLARQAALFLDEGGIFSAQREKSFAPEEWSVRGPEIHEMNANLDGMLRLQREGRSS